MSHLIRSRENRQLVLYTDQEKKPEGSFPLPPRGVIQVQLSEDQIAYLRATYGQSIQIS